MISSATDRVVEAPSGASRFSLSLDPKLLGSIENPEMTVGHWVNLDPGVKKAKVSSGLKYPPKRSAFDRMLQKPKKFAIRPNLSKTDVAHRSHKDFALLRDSLVNNFPGAFIPALPKSKTKSAMNYFLEYLLCNPFFRNDFALKYFLDDNVSSYAAALKKHRRSASEEFSEGAVRWQQAMASYENRFSRDFQRNHLFFSKLKSELKNLHKNLRTLQINVKHQMGLQESQALANSEMSTVLQNMLSMEANMDSLDPNLKYKSNESSQSMNLKASTQRTAKSVHLQTGLLRKEYGAPVLQKRVLDPIENQISIICVWLKHISTAETKSKAYSSLDKRIVHENKGKGKDELIRRREHLGKTLLETYQGLFGIELDMYRLYRVSMMEKILNNFSFYHLIGAEKTFRNWDIHRTVVTTALDEYDLKETCLNKKGRFRKNTFIKKELKIKKNLVSEDAFNPVILKVKPQLERKKGLLSMQKKKFLKLTPNQILVGHKIEGKKNENLWYAIDAHGGKGFVYAENVTVEEDSEVVAIRPTSPSKPLIECVDIVQNVDCAPPEATNIDFGTNFTDVADVIEDSPDSISAEITNVDLGMDLNNVTNVHESSLLLDDTSFGSKRHSISVLDKTPALLSLKNEDIDITRIGEKEDEAFLLNSPDTDVSGWDNALSPQSDDISDNVKESIEPSGLSVVAESVGLRKSSEASQLSENTRVSRVTLQMNQTDENTVETNRAEPQSNSYYFLNSALGFFGLGSRKEQPIESSQPQGLTKNVDSKLAVPIAQVGSSTTLISPKAEHIEAKPLEIEETLVPPRLVSTKGEEHNTTPTPRQNNVIATTPPSPPFNFLEQIKSAKTDGLLKKPEERNIELLPQAKEKPSFLSELRNAASNKDVHLKKVDRTPRKPLVKRQVNVADSILSELRQKMLQRRQVVGDEEEDD